jgi:hypothetical protein
MVRLKGDVAMFFKEMIYLLGILLAFAILYAFWAKVSTG